MPVDWPFEEGVLQLGGTGARKIAAEDGARQETTARSILRDLAQQPGLVLADEVGMGKTYVALAVVAAALPSARETGRPVIVMMPPGLASKWQREWDHFRASCCVRPEALSWVRDEPIETPIELIMKLELPKSRRPHLIWVTTGSFGKALEDPWIKLAFIRLARRHTRMDEETRKSVCKWATSLVRLKSEWRLTPELVERLLTTELERWGNILGNEGILEADGEALVPEGLLKLQDKLPWSELAAQLHDVPGRRGPVSEQRLKESRQAFNQVCQGVYRAWLACAGWRASLLVLDEAHHAKNDSTRLARLLRSEDAELLVGGESEAERPLLWDKFDRMLLLTATPFQLGHHELIRVLRTFAAVNWSGPAAPDFSRERFLADMEELEGRLDANRRGARRLDQLWGRLERDRVVPGDGEFAVHLQEWWARVNGTGPRSALEQEIFQAVEDCRQSRARAEDDPLHPWASLRTWVIRHNRPTELANRAEGERVPRRVVRPGRALGDTAERNEVAFDGLPLTTESALPFLLAARAQGELAHGSASARAFFAEGLCSSYEAFHHTRDNRGDARDVGDDGVEVSEGQGVGRPETEGLVPVSWYEERIASLIPSRSAAEAVRYAHPKLRPVVERTVDLWAAGEKVLIFCFYRETARALHRHLRREVGQRILTLTADKLGLEGERRLECAEDALTRIARRLSDARSPFHQEVQRHLRAPFASKEFHGLKQWEEQLVGLLTAYVRSAPFIARYLPLESPEVRRAFSEDRASNEESRAGVAALGHALTERMDGSALTMAYRLEEFLRFAKELAERARFQSADEGEDPETRVDPLRQYLDALAVHVRRGGERDETDDDDASGAADGSWRMQGTVRLVYGQTKREARERLMLSFNSPLLPEVLVSSSVLGEGVDLHRFCRYVIHHDLCWNPSTIEQRTGRLDRIRCKAELAGRPIVIYEPYLAGSADERMFRVVRDRERWFQVVMGQKFEFDEATAEQLANRVPLPEALAAELVFDLRRAKSAG